MHPNEIPQNKTGSRRLIPVIRQQRKKWHIPRIDAHEQLLEQKREEERIQALCEGTTPQGREILRKIMFRATRMLEENSSDSQIIIAVQGELNQFEVLRPEFLLLLHRLWGVSLEKLCQAPAMVIAMLMLLSLKIDRQRRKLKTSW